jgi:hypothetical protein
MHVFSTLNCIGDVIRSIEFRLNQIEGFMRNPLVGKIDDYHVRTISAYLEKIREDINTCVKPFESEVKI